MYSLQLHIQISSFSNMVFITHSKLLQGGTVLIHAEYDNVKAIKADLLIVGNIISKN